MCVKLANGGADCKWRAAFSFTGYLLLEVSNATAFVSNPDVQVAVTLSVANITALPYEFISTDMEAAGGNQTRRLLSTRLLSTNGNVMLTYAGSVQGDAQPTPTAKEVAAALISATLDDFTLLFKKSFDDGEIAFAASVLEKSDVTVTLFDSSGTQTSTTIQSSTTQSSVPQISQTEPQIFGTQSPEDPDRDDAPGLAGFSPAHVLAFVWMLCLL